MAEQTTSGGGSAPADDVPPTWMGPEEIGEEPGRSALVGTSRTASPRPDYDDPLHRELHRIRTVIQLGRNWAAGITLAGEMPEPHRPQLAVAVHHLEQAHRILWQLRNVRRPAAGATGGGWGGAPAEETRRAS